MGWIDKTIATHRDRADFAGGGFKFLVGFEAKPHVWPLTAVVWPAIAPHDVGHVDVTVDDVRKSRFHKVVAYAPEGFEADFLTSAIIGDDTVRLTAANHTASPLTPTTRDWPDVFVFMRRGTGR